MTFSKFCSSKFFALCCLCFAFTIFIPPSANAACTWQSWGPYATTPALIADTFDANCGPVVNSACPGCTSFPAMASCSEGASCDGVPHPDCLINANVCSMTDGNTAYTWDRYQCVCSGPENGVCGSANGGRHAPAPDIQLLQLCSAGTASAVTKSGGNWVWTCDGSGGGSNASCSSIAPSCWTGITEACTDVCGFGSPGGTLSEFQFGDGNTSYAGPNSCVSHCGGQGSGFYTTLAISSGGALSSCSTPVNGSCGGEHGTTSATPPGQGSIDLCNSGTASTVSGSGPWTWSCNGSGGGTTANCTQYAPVAVNGSCGTSNGGTFPNATPPSTNLCGAGSATAVATNPTTYTWSCNGSGGGTNSSCTATRAPAIVNGSCGTSNGGTFPNATPPSTNLCGAGSATAVATNPTTYTWSCNGSGGGTNSSCTATRSAVIVNGTCGSANGVAVATQPSANLCDAGSATAVSGSGPWTWNCNGSGGGTNASCSAPFSGTGSACEASQVAMGRTHTCALTTAGGVKCWGSNNRGGIGDGTTTNRLAPTNVSGLTSGVTKIVSSLDNTCALTTTGGVRCWGYNLEGQLGDGTTTQRNSPVNVTGLTSGVADIAAGSDHICALTTSGGMKCWGRNNVGKLGDGTTTNRSTPVDVSGLTSGVIKIAAGAGHTCAVTSSGVMKCWGENEASALGDSTVTDSSVPIDATTATTNTVSIMALADNYSCIRTTSGGVRCWGNNAVGEIGDGTTTNRMSAVNVSGLTSGVTSVTAGGRSSCAITTSGGLKCWGSNTSGQLGDGTTTNRLTPVDVTGLTSGVTNVNGNLWFRCAVTNTGAVRCWGNNVAGQLGDGTTTNRLTPVNVTLCAPVNGVCGAANGSGQTSAPSSGLCSQGTATPVTGTGPWNWNCNGLHGGTNASCFAVVQVNGSCGPANGVGTSSAPSSGLCSTGSASAVSGSGPFTWTCNGVSGGTNASCSAPLVANGVCGTSNGGSFYSAPSTNLCNTGAASAVSGSGPYTWTCAGVGGGSTANCNASRRFDGVCGTANTVPSASAPSSGLCSTGNATSVTNSSNTWNWNCNGINGGTNATCSAPEQINGTCGPANGSSVFTAPSSGLCATGNATSVTGAGPFDWNCNGINGGTNATCSANLTVNGVCGPAHGAFSSSAPSSGLCSAGSAGAVGGTGPFTWTCGGLNGGTDIGCSSQVVVQGTCGTANNVVTTTAPAAGLCATGTATAVTGAGPWTWSCTGSGGGTNSTCTAPTPPPPPTFGGACPA